MVLQFNSLIKQTKNDEINQFLFEQLTIAQNKDGSFGLFFAYYFADFLLRNASTPVESLTATRYVSLRALKQALDWFELAAEGTSDAEITKEATRRVGEICEFLARADLAGKNNFSPINVPLSGEVDVQCSQIRPVANKGPIPSEIVTSLQHPIEVFFHEKRKICFTRSTFV